MCFYKRFIEKNLNKFRKKRKETDCESVSAEVVVGALLENEFGNTEWEKYGQDGGPDLTTTIKPEISKQFGVEFFNVEVCRLQPSKEEKDFSEKWKKFVGPIRERVERIHSPCSVALGFQDFSVPSEAEWKS